MGARTELSVAVVAAGARQSCARKGQDCAGSDSRRSEVLYSTESEVDSMNAAALHDSDRFAWLEQQTQLLRSGALGELDVIHLIQEPESEMGNERRELYRRLRVLVAHLLKWQLQPAGRGNSWKGTIRIQRNDIARLFKETPSLRRFLADELAEVYCESVEWAADATGLADETFPSACPYSIDAILSRDYWPER
jgi:hypothetical protein